MCKAIFQFDKLHLPISSNFVIAFSWCESNDTGSIKPASRRSKNTLSLLLILCLISFFLFAESVGWNLFLNLRWDQEKVIHPHSKPILTFLQDSGILLATTRKKKYLFLFGCIFLWYFFVLKWNKSLNLSYFANFQNFFNFIFFIWNFIEFIILKIVFTLFVFSKDFTFASTWPSAITISYHPGLLHVFQP